MELPEGPLEQFTHEMEPFLRKQGMPVRLNKGALLLSSTDSAVTGKYAKIGCNIKLSWCAGVVELVSDFVVCEEGKPLSPESARILVCFGLSVILFIRIL